MGCDIHAHFEIKVDNEWLHYSAPRFERDYNLFEKMAGVRGLSENAISPPKGLPDDISKTVLLNCKWMGSDGHSHSWLNKKEIRELYAFHAKDFISIWEQWGYLGGSGWECFDEYKEDYPAEIQDIRLVFWFDN